jgi:hypothetical protein
MELLRIEGLPADPLAAAAVFHVEWLPRARQALAQAGELLVVQFPPADHTHHAWRLAAVQGLAREYAPQRVNGVTSDSASAIASACAYLAAAPGLTGQLLSLADAGAGLVLD